MYWHMSRIMHMHMQITELYQVDSMPCSCVLNLWTSRPAVHALAQRLLQDLPERHLGEGLVLLNERRVLAEKVGFGHHGRGGVAGV